MRGAPLTPRLVIAAAVAAVLGYWMFGNPDVTFRSSDGKWADSEFQIKGRDLRIVVSNFETYKLACRAPKVVLLRATPIDWYNVFAWPSYFRDRKWRVPYSSAHPETGDYFPPASAESCYNNPQSEAVLNAAELSGTDI